MNKWVRQIHRWVSIAFTMTVIANFAAMTQGQPPAWVTYSPLLPLALLLFTGLYLFVLPYATKWRIGRSHKLEDEPWRKKQTSRPTWGIGAERPWPACGR